MTTLTCPSCGGLSRFEGRCNACIAADYDDFDDDDCCYECGGEGFVSDCFEEWACLDPEYGCDFCTHRCPLCNPAKPNPELQQVLADALASGIETGTAKTEGLGPKDESPSDAPNNQPNNPS